MIMLLLTILSPCLPKAGNTPKAVTVITDNLHLLPQGVIGHISNEEALVSPLKISIQVTLASTPMRSLEFILQNLINIMYTYR